LHLPADQFKRQLDLLQRWLHVVPVTELSAPSPTGRPKAVITFDDAYLGAVTIALAELRDRGLPAAMFVAPGRLGGDQFWWDTLAGNESIDKATWFFILRELRGDELAVQRWAAGAGLRRQDVPELWRSSSLGELRNAAYPGLMFGAHSWSHRNLAALCDLDLENELTSSQTWLVEQFGKAYVPWLAFPYGMYSPVACASAGRKGFVGALRIEGGWTRLPLAEPLAVPRLNVSAGISPDGFTLRISGLFGA
jgi:peptidoglycan/xylan/chitin deacetylase (PgdA/CDA1 family)